MLIIDPPATAGGTDIIQLRLLTLEAKHWWAISHVYLDKSPSIERDLR